MQPNLVYVGTYTRNGQAEGIYVFQRDPETGTLTRLSMAEAYDPSFLAFSPDKRFLFAVNEYREFAGEGEGKVSSFAVDQQTGALTFLSQQSTRGGEPCHLTTDESGRWLIVANQSSDSLVMFSIDPQTGRLHANGQSFQIGTPSCVRFLPLH